MTIALTLLLLALQVADWWTTRRILAAGGKELNVVVRWLINRIGYEWGLIVVKGTVAALLLVGLFITTEMVWWWPWALAALTVYYAAIVVWNLIQLRKQHGDF